MLFSSHLRLSYDDLAACQVSKRRGEKYQLKWKESPDFVRLASKLGATIIPFAAVGGDDAFDFNMDSREILQNPILGPLAREFVRRVDPNLDPEEAVPPLMNLPGLPIPSPVPIPRPERIYFRYCPSFIMDGVSCHVVWLQLHCLLTSWILTGATRKSWTCAILNF